MCLQDTEAFSEILPYLLLEKNFGKSIKYKYRQPLHEKIQINADNYTTK